MASMGQGPVSTAMLEFPELRQRQFDLVLARLDEHVGEASGDDLQVETLCIDKPLLAAGIRTSSAKAVAMPLFLNFRDGPEGKWPIGT